ncbi:Con-6 family protein [Aspergillus affinis]|uniref:Con-6 family protein n=1 Tax=Aspergillus affinis TaxID=1070780 RepID=UPI0022FEA8D7|nr:uncharacterized protein KD926_004468 [Aspergillus affinis]KAI9035152.1 hypothetical protein KD926_004468 [Aspergillus affinis]
MHKSVMQTTVIKPDYVHYIKHDMSCIAGENRLPRLPLPSIEYIAMTTEERLNQMRGYKATLSNPNVSDEAKEHAEQMLQELGGNQPQEEIHHAQGYGKDPMRVNAGLKAAQQNPNVSQSGKQAAAEKLDSPGD